MQRLLMASSLALGLASAGCGDDDEVPESSDDDAGSGMDSGPEDDAGMADAGKMDAARDTGSGGPTTTCGAQVCEGALIANNVVNPCCVEGTNACGLNADDIKKAVPASPFTGCVPKDVPAAHTSEYCGAFFDQVETEGDHANGGLDIKSGARYAVFEGCCLDTGECGANISVPRDADESLNSHLGCVSFSRIRDAFASGDGGVTATPAHLPFCNPASGDAPVTGTVPGVPSFVCGCGEGNTDSGQGLPCLNNLASDVCGADQPTAAQLAEIPEIICGCTADSKLPCLRNLPLAACGTKEITADSAELAAIPEFICGAGTTPSALPTLPNVDPSVCGKKAITADSAELDEIPVFICGAEGGESTQLPTMRNVASTVCGKKAISTGSAELGAIPEFICGETSNPLAGKLPTLRTLDVTVCGGKAITSDSAELDAIPVFVCGAEGSQQPSQLPTLPNVESTLCGKKAITADSPELAAVPQFICGETSNPLTGKLPTLRNVDVSVCGTKVITSDSVELNAVPVFICGAISNPDTTTLPKLPNVSAAICGKLAVSAGSPYLAAVPEFSCGCTGRNDPKLGCLRNLAANVCGGLEIGTDSPYLAGIPKFVCGCGPSSLDTEFGKLCMGNVETTTCGSRDATLNDRGTPDNATDDCLVGVPEYARGCGLVEAPTGSSCLRQTPQLFGCDNVASGPILRLPEYLCGCGEAKPVGSGTADASLPCLPFVLETICGAIPISASQQVTLPIPNIVCGCGDNQTTQLAPCLDNVPSSVCGSQQMCVLDQTGTDAGCDDGEICADRQGGPNSGTGGAGGDGDGIGDHCVPQ
jgi:hypothetical protein